MSEEKILEDPTNRVVSVFDDRQQAEAAREELCRRGFTKDQVRVMQGQDAAEKVDTSAKWFADTDAEIQRYQQALIDGKTVISVPVTNHESRDRVHQILKHHEAHSVTHFGEWITEMMK